MLSRNRRRPMGRLDRTAPRTTRVDGTGPAPSVWDPARPCEAQLSEAQLPVRGCLAAVHGHFVIAVPDQLDHATAAQLLMAITAPRDDCSATLDPRDSTATPISPPFWTSWGQWM